MARHAIAPIDHGAEHVEDQRLDGVAEISGRGLRPRPRRENSGIGERGGCRERGDALKQGTAVMICHCLILPCGREGELN